MKSWRKGRDSAVTEPPYFADRRLKRSCKTTWELFSGPRRTVCSEGLVGVGYSEVALTWFFHHIWKWLYSSRFHSSLLLFLLWILVGWLQFWRSSILCLDHSWKMKPSGIWSITGLEHDGMLHGAGPEVTMPLPFLVNVASQSAAGLLWLLPQNSIAT